MGVLDRPGASTPEPAFQLRKTMSTNEPNADNDTGVLLADRSRRALTEPLSVVTLDGTPVADETVVSVISHSGENHTVDVAEGRCTCKDAEYNLPDGDRKVCKHVERARVATGGQVLDAAVIRHLGDEIDPQLGAHADGPTVATADGGIIVADDDGEIIDETDDEVEGEDDGRPEDCACRCFETDGVDLPCWPCYRDGFETVADGVEIVDGEEPDAQDDDNGRPTPTRSEPADLGGGETTGVQDL